MSNINLTVVDSLDEGDDGTKTVQRHVTQRIGDFEVPYGYELWGDGIYHISGEITEDATPDIQSTPSGIRRQAIKVVAHEPVWIRRFGRTLDTGEQLVELTFRDVFTHEIQTEWVNRLQLASKQMLVKLSRLGLPVNDGNINQMLHYLDAALHTNGTRLEVVLVAARNGAYPVEFLTLDEESGHTEKQNGYGWLVGERWIGPPNTHVVADPRSMHTSAQGYTVSGSEEEWFTHFKQICEVSPIARWLTYSTFAAPLLRFVRQRTFIVHHWGESGGGKTALAKFAMSAWGDPSRLTQSFNRTQLSFVELFRHIDDLPLTFDELQASGMKDHATLIYALCLEQGRGRATPDGKLQEQIASWRSVVRMTGEEPIIGKGGMIDLGGQANRVVQIGTPVLSQEQGSATHRWLEGRHFGWGGLRFLQGLQQLMEFPDGEQALQEKFDEFRTEIFAQLTESVHSRVLHLTIVALATYLANRWFFDADPDAARASAIQDAIVVGRTIAQEEIRETLAEQALQLFRDHFASHRGTWYDLSDQQQQELLATGNYRQLTGVLAPNEIWLIQKEANSLLNKAGFPQRRVWADLHRLGILHAYARKDEESVHKQFGVPRKFGKFHAKVYVLHRPLTGAFTGDDPHHP
jgi:hypothetical protein